MSIGEALGQGSSGCIEHDHPEPKERCPSCAASAAVAPELHPDGTLWIAGQEYVPADELRDLGADLERVRDQRDELVTALRACFVTGDPAERFDPANPETERLIRAALRMAEVR